ncbi:MAG: hypothetical protein R2744_01980 [Bacteroidales bacterium]
MNRKLSLSFLFLIFSLLTFSQPKEEVIRSFFNDALTSSSAEENLRYLCKETPGRLAGSEASLKAIEFTAEALREAGADTVWLQEVMVPHWVRGEEHGSAVSAVYGRMELNIGALGLSVGTGKEGITANIVEVTSFDQLKELGKEVISGKIVFFNRPVDNTLIDTFRGYSGSVSQRVSGASEASPFGALAVIVRSPTQANHDFIHTGVVRYYDGDPGIPAMVISRSAQTGCQNG